MVLIILFVRNYCFGQEIIEKECYIIHYSHIYEPKKITLLEEVPYEIRNKLKNHLLDRIGKEYYSKIEFVKGLIINYKEMLKQDPKAKNKKWKIPAYDLDFKFSDIEKGIKYYCTKKITLDSLGKVINEIELPNLKKNPDRKILTKKSTILEIIKRQKFNLDNCTLEYYQDDNIMVWKCEKYNKKKYEKRKKNYGKAMTINAHNGKIISKGKMSGGIIYFNKNKLKKVCIEIINHYLCKINKKGYETRRKKTGSWKDVY